MIDTMTLRPGYLVQLSTTLRGNVRYNKATVEGAHITDGGVERESWKTERITQDPDEQERGDQARRKVRMAIMRVCVSTQFGPLCPEQDKPMLDAAIVEARNIAKEYNATTRYARLKVYMLAGRVAPDDAEAVRSIKAEISDLMDIMRQGLAELDPKKVRDAAARARSIGMMLSPGAQATVQVAIEAARAQAREIVAAGEGVAIQIDQSALARINAARTMFLDLEDAREVGAPVEKGRGIDLEGERAVQDARLRAFPDTPKIDLN